MSTEGHVFISYSRKDKEFVSKLVRDLRANSVEVWLDSDSISSGQRWDSVIEAAIRSASALVVAMSKSSTGSNNVLDEINLALTENIRVIPILIEETNIPFRLMRLEYIDFREDYATGLKKLVSELPRPKVKHSPEDLFNVDDSIVEFIPVDFRIEGKYVLVVEDTIELAVVIAATIETMGLKCRYETHGTKALALVSKNRPELILLDIGLPDMSGWKFLEEIKRIFQSQVPAIVVITAYGDPANRLVGRLQGVKGYLTKPFTPTEVEQVVRKTLELPEA